MKRESAELYPMLDLEEALARVLAAFEPLEPEQVPIVEALGQVLAEDVFAEMDIPPLANTAMDGYAVRCDDTGGARHDHPRRLRVAADMAAGNCWRNRSAPARRCAS